MRLLVLALTLLFSLPLLSQTYQLTWGEEIQLKRGSTNFDVVHADESGIYLVEGMMRGQTYILYTRISQEFKLMKFDRNYKLLYENEIGDLLGNYNFKSIQFLKGEMYLFAYEFFKDERRYVIYGAKMDRGSGKRLGGFKQLASFDLDSKKDRFSYSFTPTPDSSHWMLVGDVSSPTQAAISVVLVDPQLTVKSKTPINFSFEPKAFVLEDVIATRNDKLLVVGKKYEDLPTGKGKKTALGFSGYLFSKYDLKGKKELDLSTDHEGRFATSSQVLVMPDGSISLAGFYSNDPKKKKVHGFFLSKVDMASGKVVQSSYKPVSEDMMDQAVAGEEENEGKSKKSKKKEDEEGISKDFIIRAVEYDKSSGTTILIAEVSKVQSGTSTSFDNGRTKSESFSLFTNSDLMVIKTSKDGMVEWINTLPKKQEEYISSYSGIAASSYFTKNFGMPFYSSFSYLATKDKIVFLLNDSKSNKAVTKLGDKFYEITDFRYSVTYGVTLDLKTGQFSRKVIQTNSKDEPILLPRFSYVVGNEFLFPAMRLRSLGKTDFKMGKVQVKGL